MWQWDRSGTGVLCAVAEDGKRGKLRLRKRCRSTQSLQMSNFQVPGLGCQRPRLFLPIIPNSLKSQSALISNSHKFHYDKVQVKPTASCCRQRRQSGVTQCNQTEYKKQPFFLLSFFSLCQSSKTTGVKAKTDDKVYNSFLAVFCVSSFHVFLNIKQFLDNQTSCHLFTLLISCWATSFTEWVTVDWQLS